MLNEDQLEQIAALLINTEMTVTAALTELSMGGDSRRVEQQLNNVGVEICAGCGLWKDDVRDEYCELCEPDDE